MSLIDYGKRKGFKRDWSEWHAALRASCGEVRHEL